MGDNGNGKYPHSEFRIPACDSKGHSERLQLRLQPELVSRMQKVVNSKLWPYDNYQELIRHAVHQHLRWLENDNPKVGNLVAQIEAVNLSLQEEEEHQRIEHMYEKTKLMFNANRRLVGNQAGARNLKMMSEVWDRIQSIDDKFWRKVWMDRFKEEYKTILESAPGASLTEMEDEDGGE